MLTTNIAIKIAGINDAAALRVITISTFCDAFAQYNTQENMDKYLAEQLSLEQITEELSDTNSLFFLVHDQDQLIGYAKMRTHHEPAELDATNPIEIERIYIDKHYQGRKIGDAVIAYCTAYANTRQHDVLWLGVWEHNTGAIRFYERLGFTAFGSHVFMLGDDKQTDILMKKNLRP